MLLVHNGWGMRIAFVPEEWIHEQPNIQVRSRDGTSAEMRRSSGAHDVVERDLFVTPSRRKQNLLSSYQQARASINTEAQICSKKSSFREPLRNIERRRLSKSGNDISFISGDRRKTNDLRKCANDQVSLGAPSGFERRRQSACSRDRVRRLRSGRSRKGAGADRPASTEGENALHQRRSADGCAFWAGSRKPTGSAATHRAEVEAFEAWMRQDRGLSEETIRDYRAVADQFFDWLAAINIPLAPVKIIHIDDAITDKKAGEPQPEDDA